MDISKEEPINDPIEEIGATVKFEALKAEEGDIQDDSFNDDDDDDTFTSSICTDLMEEDDTPVHRIEGNGSDPEFFEISIDELEAYSSMAEYSYIDFDHWALEENAGTYLLFKNDQEFGNNARKYMTAAMQYGNKSIATCHRAHSRKPTVKEFWNYYLSKTVPRHSWYAYWKVINPDRRGWPMQYTVKAKLLVKSISFQSPIGAPTTEIEVVESEDDRFAVGQSLEVALWELEPCEPGPEFLDDGISIEEGKAALQFVRKFFEEYYLPCDTRNFAAYFENCWYERLELIYYLDHPTPTQGTLSSKDRLKIINGIKYFHNLRYMLQDLNNETVEGDIDGNEDAMQRQELDRKYLTLQMQLDRHKVELRFLLDKTMRTLMGAISENNIGDDDDSSVSNYDYILVIKSLKSNDLLKMHETVNPYLTDDPDANIRVVNDLDTALKKCSIKSTIFVASGEYAISGLGRLAGGGAIIGVPLNGVDVTITPTDDVGDIWITVATHELDVTLTLQDLNFVVDEDSEKTLDSCIHLTAGSLKMKDCTVRLQKRVQRSEDQRSGAVRTVRVSDGATFTQEGCKFDDVGEGK